jgi:hypothetical protein
MSLSGIPWGSILTEAVTMFLCLAGVGLGLVGIRSLWSRGRH